MKVSKSKHSSAEKAQVSFGTVELNFAGFSELITTAAWSPSTYKQGARKADNFESSELIALDIDSGTTLEDAKTAIETAGYSYILAPSKSHQIEKNGVICDRFRIVLFIETAITNATDYKATISAVIAELGVNADKACVDVARFYFPCKSVHSSRLLGRKVAPVKAADLPSPRATAVVAAKGEVKLFYKTLNFIAFGAVAGEWHSRFLNAAVDIKSCGYSIDEAAGLLAKASPGGKLDATDMHQLRDVYKRAEYVADKTSYVVKSNRNSLVKTEADNESIIAALKAMGVLSENDNT